MKTPTEIIYDALWDECTGEGEEQAREIIEALDAAGYVIVPKEPTDHMIDCMMSGFHLDEAPRTAMRDAYRNMVLAKP